jgi:exodeoxyribonuclease VII small subunit
LHIGSAEKRRHNRAGDARVSLDDDIAAMPFEKALAELESIVARLERGEVDLEESIRSYERGEKLKQQCEQLLKSAEMRVNKIVLGKDGKPVGVEPLDPA